MLYLILCEYNSNTGMGYILVEIPLGIIKIGLLLITACQLSFVKKGGGEVVCKTGVGTHNIIHKQSEYKNIPVYLL